MCGEDEVRRVRPYRRPSRSSPAERLVTNAVTASFTRACNGWLSSAGTGQTAPAISCGSAGGGRRANDHEHSLRWELAVLLITID